jgi:hypothetical protein
VAAASKKNGGIRKIMACAVARGARRHRSSGNGGVARRGVARRVWRGRHGGSGMTSW